MTWRREPTARLTGLGSMCGSGLFGTQERQVRRWSSYMFSLSVVFGACRCSGV